MASISISVSELANSGPRCGVNVNVGTLAPGASHVIDGYYTVKASDLGGPISTTSTADSDQTGPVTDSVTVNAAQSTLLLDASYVGIEIDARTVIRAGPVLQTI